MDPRRFTPRHGTSPKLENVVYGDGKVIQARTRKARVDRETGEIRPRCEPDLETYVVGGGQRAKGIGFVFLGTRGEDINRRVILDVIDAPGKGGEAKHAIAAFERTLPLLPGSQVGLYDGAWRGKHRRAIYKQGKIPVSPGRNRDTNPNQRERHLGAAIVRRSDGTEEEVQLQIVDESPNIKEIADDGSPLYTPLKRVKTTGPASTSGRTYCEWAVPAECGGGIVRLRVTSSPEEEAGGVNREEWLHPFALGDPDYHRLMGRRNDAESGNNTLDNSMWRERAHSIGRPAILFNLITWALYQNAQARALYAQRAGPETVAA